MPSRQTNPCAVCNCAQLNTVIMHVINTHFFCLVFALDIALDEPIKDDGFGGEGVDFLSDGFGDELGGGDALVPGFDDLPTTVAAADVTLEPADTNLDEHKEVPVAEPGQEEGVYIIIYSS